MFKEHFYPKPSIISQRYKFNCSVRQPGESVSSSVEELKRLTEFCEFGAGLDDMLRDRFMFRISDS